MRRAAVDDVPDVGFAAASTTGGSGGTTTTVTTLEELTEAVKGDEAKIVIIDGTITGSEVVKVGANTSVLGAAGSLLDGVGLRAYKVDNIIFRNIKIQKVLAEAGDAIGVQEANNVWVDHCDLSSDRDHDKDFYDGLLDVTHGSTGVTLSNNYIHDHWKASLVGHSDNNGDEDAALQVTYTGNFFENLNSRGPSFRFGTGHLFNNYYSGVSDGINTRDGAQLLVENNVFVDSKKALYSTDEGFAVATGNDFGNSENTASEGTLTSMDYEYTLLDTSEVAASVQASAGQTLDFSA
ncbi:polysaccharide lyase family 1 protein [Schizophyllum amplum]|uniref:pectate lyase n=1 Tax=Schizophyllum amplum TaxID=97359 RepID=A0A550CTP5_9AGAR|nr:polysaccharide lyase family 1 protein [Auriculariopsis ampla]